MTTFGQNLKFIYQRKLTGFLCLLIVYILGIIFGVQGELPLCCFFMFLLGIIVSSLLLEVADKPFSFELPGWPNAARKMLMWVGGTMVVSWALIAAPFNEIAYLTGYFSVGIILYWFAAWMMFLFRENWVYLFMPVYFVLAIQMRGYVDIGAFIEEHPILLLMGAVLATAGAWWYWGRQQVYRRRVEMRKFPEGVKKDEYYALLSKEVTPGLEEFFVGRIEAAQLRPAVAQVWGGLYQTYAVAMSRIRSSWLYWVIFILVISFLSGRQTFVMFGTVLLGVYALGIPMMTACNVPLHLHSNMLLKGGRRERFGMALSLAVVASVLVAGLLLLLNVVNILILQFWPALGKDPEWKALGSYPFGALVMVSLWMMPFLLLFRLLVGRAGAIALAILLYIGTLIAFLAEKFTFEGLAGFNLVMAVVSWLLFIKALHYVCWRGDLTLDKETFGFPDVFGRTLGRWMRRVFHPMGR